MFVTRVTGRVPHVEQELLILQEYLGSSPVFLMRFVLLDFKFSVYCFEQRCLSFCPFFLVIVFSVFHRFAASDYPFDIFKLFLSGSLYLGLGLDICIQV